MAIYSDFYNDFTAHPDTHDLAMKTDSRAIQQSLRNLVLTDTWSRPFKSKVGGDLRQLLFAEISDIVSEVMKSKIEELIKNYEKRVVVKQVVVQGNGPLRRYDIAIQYYELNNPSPSVLYLQLDRIR